MKKFVIEKNFGRYFIARMLNGSKIYYRCCLFVNKDLDIYILLPLNFDTKQAVLNEYKKELTEQ